MKGRLTLLTAAFAAVESFAATSVVYDASDPQTSYANGAVTMTYDGGGAITSIAADSTVADGVTFTGDAMTIAPGGADVTLPSSGLMTFNNDLNATGASSDNPAKVVLKAAQSGVRVVTLPTRLTYNEQLVARGMTLTQITNLVARYDKDAGQGGSGIPCDGVKSYFYKVDRTTLSCQFQKKTSSAVVRVVCVDLVQRKDGVYASATAYGHFNPVNHGDAVEGDIDITEEWDYFESFTSGSSYYKGCFVTNLTVYCDCDVGGHVELNSGGTLTNTKLQVGDGVTPMTAHLNNKGSFPASGAIEVDTNSVLTIRVGGTNVTGLDKKVPIVVRKDGRIITAIASIFDASSSDITLDGGIISVSPYGSVTGDSGIYFKDVKFRGGAHIDGAYIRVRNANVRWTVEGDKPAWCSNIIDVWNHIAEGQPNYKIGKFTLDIANVTGDSKPDFVCSGTIRPTTTTAAGYTKGRVVKTGVGTLGIEGPFIMTNTATRIEAGTMLFNGDRLASELPCHFVRAGGTFAVSAGSTNTCGTLAVESASAISVADGASLSFAASDGESWNGALTLRCNLEACSIRFGTGSDGLTRGQCAKISLSDGRRVRLDENGYVVESLPFVLIVR